MLLLLLLLSSSLLKKEMKKGMIKKERQKKRKTETRSERQIEKKKHEGKADRWGKDEYDDGVGPGVCLFCLLVAYRPSNMRVYLRDGSAQTILRAATLR